MASKQPDKVIIDTNLWISFLISKDIKKLDPLITENKIQLIFSKEVLQNLLTFHGDENFKNILKYKTLQECLN